MGNGEAKEPICMTHGQELVRGGECWWAGGYRVEGNKEGGNGATVIASSIKYIKKETYVLVYSNCLLLFTTLISSLCAPAPLKGFLAPYLFQIK